MINPVSITVGFLLIIVFAHAACSQRKLTDISEKDEVALKFQHPAKLGTTKKYLINQRDIPNAPTIPNGYKLLENKSYFITTEVIDLGHPRIFFKVPVAQEEEFKKVRILHLTANEIMPGGYEWQDCTISLEVVRGQRDPKWLEEHKDFDSWYTERMIQFLPDYSKKTVFCENIEKWNRDEYFVVASQTEPAPTGSFTDLKLVLVSEQKSADTGQTVYKIRLKNNGAKKIEQLSFRSGFDLDMR